MAEAMELDTTNNNSNNNNNNILNFNNSNNISTYTFNALDYCDAFVLAFHKLFDSQSDNNLTSWTRYINIFQISFNYF